MSEQDAPKKNADANESKPKQGEKRRDRSSGDPSQKPIEQIIIPLQPPLIKHRRLRPTIPPQP